MPIHGEPLFGLAHKMLIARNVALNRSAHLGGFRLSARRLKLTGK